MQTNYQELLKPEILHEVSGLSLLARVVVDGYLQGLNRSKSLGSGMEFSQYRGYEPGDDLRLLDWKMLARSGRYYIKQSEIESQVSVKFILDASNSMLHQEGNLTKMDYARILVASLSYLAHKQGDEVGLFALSESNLTTIYPKASVQHFNRLLEELIRIETVGKWPPHAITNERLHERGRKELIFFITDMYEHGDELSAFTKALKTSRNEVAVLQILGKDELNFEYSGTVTFEDLETGTKLKVAAKEARTHYLENLTNKLKKTEELLLNQGISHQVFTMGEPLGATLNLFLKKRINLV
ncbi:DUF58 domain-containing protein [Leeuwenhoekiella polynyae]|uniref:DUF58 domain-containing protein n=1 Tax=Leeuwenhoekiella polynyae TaxID=1550906 RepID=A0A4Q0PJS5_9FLAO|nr:DUF58 domain-containing protein [Leeuwenhoekiella polynyae]RXG26621.1 putative protein DUF58 [Leeuwenhoekiella polynyae]